MTQQVIVDYQSSPHHSTAVYPANTQVWHAAKDANDDFDPELLDKIYQGNSEVSKGHFVIEAFNKDREGASGLAALNNAKELNVPRPSSVCAYAGRLWYAGPSGGGGTSIYVSQIVRGLANAARCYSQNDPTAESFNSLLATDGLVIRIPEMGEVRKLIPFNRGVVAMADNGVWYIRGGDLGFKPTDFIQTKLSDLGAISKTSIMEVEGSIFYVRSNGIHILSPSEAGGEVNNLTDTKIQTLISDLKRTTLLYMKGVYNKKDKKILWFYNDEEGYDGVSFRFSYNRVLVYDIRLNSFVTYTIYQIPGNDYPIVVGGIEVPDFVFSEFDEPVTLTTGETVTLTTGEELTTTVSVLGEPSINLKMPIFTRIGAGSSIGITFAEFNNTSFLDWKTGSSGVDAFAYVETGWEHMGDATKVRGAPTITTHFVRTEDEVSVDGGGVATISGESSCLMTAYWDFANNTSVKNSSQQQVYRPKKMVYVAGPYEDGQEVITTKTSVRGSGRAMKLRFETEEQKDMQLLSWSVTYNIKVEV